MAAAAGLVAESRQPAALAIPLHSQRQRSVQEIPRFGVKCSVLVLCTLDLASIRRTCNRAEGAGSGGALASLKV